MNSRAKVPSVCSGNLQQRKSGTGEVEARDTTLTRILVSDLMVSLIYILHLGCRVINIGFMNIRLYRRLRKLPADNTFCLSVKNIYSHNRRQNTGSLQLLYIPAGGHCRSISALEK